MGAPCKNTCPTVDSAISDVHTLFDYIPEPEQQYAEPYKRMAIELLEELRSNNADLRDWGCAEEERADNAERELSDAERIISDMEDERDRLQEYIKELEAE